MMGKRKRIAQQSASSFLLIIKCNVIPNESSEAGGKFKPQSGSTNNSKNGFVNNKNPGGVPLSALTVLSYSSCKKDTNTSGSIDQASVNLADDDAVTDVVFEDVFNTADNATIILDQMGKSLDTKALTVLTDSCPTITITRPTADLWPKNVIVDYGTSCTGINNNVRSGKIIIEVTGPRLLTGSKRTITFENYYFNGIKVEGTKVLENMGYNNNQNLVISVRLTDGKLTLPDGTIIERTVDHQREWIAVCLRKTSGMMNV